MEPEQREILRKWRVELVENVNIQDGLFTQLLSKGVLNSRTINRIKNNKTPEEQVEGLLDELQKRECFNTLCEALSADGQDHIVKKYLKQPVVDPPVSTVAAPSSEAHTKDKRESVLIPSETTDSSANEESDNQHCTSIVVRDSGSECVIIRFNDSSPSKRPRVSNNQNSVAVYEADETRYAMKHFVADPLDHLEKGAIVHASPGTNHNPVLVMNNPQSIVQNPNISDPSRYMAAFNPQPPDLMHLASRKLSDDVGIGSGKIRAALAPQKELSINVNEHSDSTRSDIQNLLRPNMSNTHSSLLNHANAENRGRFVNLSQSVTTNNFKINHFASLNQYSTQSEMSPIKGPRHIISTSSPVRDPDFVVRNPGLLDQIGLSRSDSVDSTKCPVTLMAASAETTDFSSLLTSSSLPSFKEVKLPQSMCADMEDIDLTDGCVNVKVEHCTEEFFHSNYKKAYAMRRMPRGYALIINVDQVVGKPARKGTNFDRDNLCNLLSQLHFNIIVFNDGDGLSAQEMVHKLRQFARMKEHDESDACFICLLSHGEEEFIFGTDGKRIPVNEIFMLFDNSHCRGLIDKPKVFIIQACRGGSLDNGVSLDEPDGGSAPNRPISQLPSMSDMLICYPTLSGYYAWRNRARGSWYIEAIVKVFMRYAKSEDVCAMLNRVNDVVSKNVSQCEHKEMNQKSQMSEYKSTLRKPHLFLFPGIATRSNMQHGMWDLDQNRRL